MEIDIMRQVIQEAMDRKAGMEFLYQKANGKIATRSVVSAVIHEDARGLPYMQAYDLGRRGLRNFRLDRILGEPVPIARPPRGYDSTPYEVDEV